jgi:hypothetical protein
MLRAIGLACLYIAATPAFAIDWPVADTSMLELSNEAVTVRFPAPVWIDEASHEEAVTDAVNVRATWRVRRGFDLVAEQIDASLDANDTWDMGPFDYLFEVFLESCAYQRVADPEPAEGSGVIMMNYAVCGYDYGNGSGGTFIGLSVEAGPEQMFDLWYVVPLRPFEIGDESAWPMSAADLEATTRAVAAAITITPR